VLAESTRQSRRRRLRGAQQQPQPVRRQRLEAVQIRPGRLPRPLFPEREPQRRQGGELAAGAERAVQPHDALYAPKSDALTGKWNPRR